jgi:hypothetical protein
MTTRGGVAFHLIARMLAGLDGDVNRRPQPELLRAEQGDAPGQDSQRLHFLDALPARRRRQRDTRRDVGDGHGGVVLKDCKNLEIDAVHGSSGRIHVRQRLAPPI